CVSRPSWGLLLLLALIGGGPTFVGTAVGRSFTSEAVSVVFLTLAAGSILYVVIQLLAVAGRSSRRDLIYLGVLIGLLAGFLTDRIVPAAGVCSPARRLGSARAEQRSGYEGPMPRTPLLPRSRVAGTRRVAALGTVFLAWLWLMAGANLAAPLYARYAD